MKIAIAQIKSVLGSLEQNLTRHYEYIDKALEGKADLVVFPELSLTGYTLKDLTSEVAVRLDDTRLSSLIARSREIDIVVGLVEESNEFLFFNTALYLSGGKIVHAHRKVYLPTYGMFEEGRHFATGNSLDTFETKFGRSGMLICEDQWHSVCPLILTLKGALLIIGIANGAARGIQNADGLASAGTWERMNTFYAINHSLYLAFVNRVGVEDGVVFWGGSEIVDPFGNRVIKGSYNNEELLFGEIDPGSVRRSRVTSPLLRDERIDFCLREFQQIWSAGGADGEVV
ncbi:MAG TPA: carbon-nitrogen hydrolase [candidate division Zixibacteria bacterium]|nr:carbon-nitrogen hydrolase [candidate division Zixibacteria bacterium]